LLKPVGAAEIDGVDAGDGVHPRGAIDSEIARIADEAPTGPEGPMTTEGGGGPTVDAIGPTEEPEV
jgi:hypothetical protein